MEPRSIPVSERLPHDGVRVLAWDSREQSWRIAYIDSIWHMVGFDDDTPICVSHWMPLPEPPAITRDALREQWDKLHGK